MSLDTKPDPLPPFPEELRPVWQRFLRLSRRRQAGMAANPLTFTEIEAFARLSRIELSAWEADLYCRLDDATLAAWRESAPSGNADEPSEVEAIPVTDTKRLRDMLRGTAARTRLIAENKAQAKAARRQPQA